MLFKKEFFNDKYKINLYLNDLFFKKNKYTKLNLKTNFFYFIFLINTFKIWKRKIFFRTFYKIHTNSNLLLSPSFMFLSQFFEYRSLFLNVLNKNNLEGFFIYKNLFKNTNYYNDHVINYIAYSGYNYYLINNTEQIFNVLNNILKNKEYNNIGKVKYFFQNYKSDFFLNYYLCYNIHMLNILEFYKIFILLNIHLIK